MVYSPQVLLNMGCSLGGEPDVIMASNIESIALATLRDALMPKLVSGELRIDKENANDI